MAMTSNDINFDYAKADFYARIVCVESAAKICTSKPETDALSLVKSLYEFVMDGASEDFKRLVVRTKQYSINPS